VAGGQALEEAVGAVLADLVREHKRIVFNGNGYADEWRIEAERRGLLNLPDAPSALPELVKPEVVAAFERYKVLTERELRARYEVHVETYNKTLNVEGQVMVLMANRYILPAVLAYQAQVAGSVAALKAAGASSGAGSQTLAELCALADEFRERTDALIAALEHPSNGSAEAHARYMRDAVVPKMVALRETGDRLELIVPSDMWPMPTYREMLFIK
jgi:glutamine synthetase